MGSFEASATGFATVRGLGFGLVGFRTFSFRVSGCLGFCKVEGFQLQVSRVQSLRFRVQGVQS